ncbi:carboxymuconolactone decarboxylase family protein [Segniliparus rugosus]|uniref:Alkylhydroperoxidase AhpD family core domain-containing protein n=1 Tax=Segniliparus rugosus (strain ATCC BAA-974 / DSM 45345 / CCUG 50838 / CIP 108380 / JCM 13579 / CDC 945) TaxID=679197 RepID=E5XPL5_SEGRC|nr:carboxymuconolactone decarboxylase family protein [Segniliparus rugosus]EFV13702.1 alkylhydroperoxidase AhpD family core domain-containing protein [Segniliparus rugosus ATCC BAA-974]
MPARLDYYRSAPGGVKTLMGVHAYIAQSGLPAELVELVNLRVSLINGCAYCLDMHTSELRKLGAAEEKITLVSVWEEAGSLFSAREQAALAWAETVTNVAETHVPDAAFAAVSEHFTEKEIADLTIAVGLINAWNRLAISFRAVPESVTKTSRNS